ncbi:DNA-binding transcriptional regulator, HxlR family [Devosia crocina]|uniref:DNA-binding transcriptional regulator, HxlR family n=1 Tax=Devosia crocina TaxID=429728 RepID=A0A1I7N779_9HYPH|nr:helix-turn-helix domain-containing protein [Devosia crocina]SFV30443.1 DNA-binding transcriptional regulator, HxlR family [Devosia crocina]
MSKHIFKDRAAHVPEFCRPTVDVMAQFGGKWFLFVLGALQHGPRRFSELEESIEGISQRMLTLTLRSLERDGYVSRHVTPSIPPRVDYALTERGHSAMQPLTALHEWASQHTEGIVESRRRFDEGGV